MCLGLTRNEFREEQEVDMASNLERIKDNFVEVEKHIDTLTAGQAIAMADSETMLLLCKHIADTIGIEAIDGLPVIDWFNRERLRRRELLLTGLEDGNPSMAARLQQTIDDAKLNHGLEDPPLD